MVDLTLRPRYRHGVLPVAYLGAIVPFCVGAFTAGFEVNRVDPRRGRFMGYPLEFALVLAAGAAFLLRWQIAAPLVVATVLFAFALPALMAGSQQEGRQRERPESPGIGCIRQGARPGALAPGPARRSAGTRGVAAVHVRACVFILGRTYTQLNPKRSASRNRSKGPDKPARTPMAT